MTADLTNPALTDAHAKLRKDVRDFFCKELAPRAPLIENDQSWDAVRAAVRATGQAGFLTFTLPGLHAEKTGPAGLVSQTIVSEEASYINYAFETTIASSLSCALPIAWHGTDEMKARYLSGLAHGETIGAIAITEPNVGSDSAGMETRMIYDKDADAYVINGFKRYISNAGVADLYIVYGITNPDEKPQKGMTALIVPADTEGLSIPRTYSFMGRRGSVVGEVALENVRVPAANRLGAEDAGFRVMLGMFNYERILLGGSGTGVARSAFDLAVAHAGKREVFNDKLGAKELMWDAVAQMSTRIDAARLLTYRAARMYDMDVRPKELMKEAAMAKLYATEASNFCADQAVRILGGDGLTKEYGRVEQIYRDARAQPIAGGTNEMMNYLIATRDLPDITLNL